MSTSDPPTNPPGPGDDDADLAQVLRAAGRRVQPPDDVVQQVRTAVHAEWRAAVAERQSRRRRWVSFAAAAGLAVVAIGVWWGQTKFAGTGVTLASVDRVTGTGHAARTWFGAGRAITAGDVLHQGDRFTTNASGGSALQLTSGISLRLDANTQIVFVSPQRVRVTSGAAYIDTGATAAHPARPLDVETPLGVVRHLGTQYEVRMSTGNLLVSVREGRVELTGPDGIKRTGASGERLTLHPDGQWERTLVRPHAQDWQWANALAAPFAIENRSLADFLTWSARELGYELVYATPESAAEAQRVILRGSVANLAPEAALSAVLSTTRLRSEIAGGKLSIALD